MLKICHILDDLKIGGLENTVKQIVLGLDKEKFSQQVWCLKDEGAFSGGIRAGGVSVRAFNFDGRMNLARAIRLAAALRKEKFDIVHAHGVYPSIWALTASIMSGPQVRIVQCQNLFNQIRLRDRIKLKFLSIFVDKFIAVSQAVKASLIESVGSKEDKIIVIHNSASEFLSISDKNKILLRDELEINEGDFVVASISRLEAHKGHSYLIESIALLKSITNLKCLIIGDGIQKRNLEILSESLGLENRVIFPGVRTDVEELLSVSSVYVQPSVLREGLPLALTEAASAGLPLIATNIGGNPEIVKDSVNGFIVEPRNQEALAEKILYLWKNTEERTSMGENSRKIWRERFSEVSMLGKISKIYESVAIKYA